SRRRRGGRAGGRTAAAYRPDAAPMSDLLTHNTLVMRAGGAWDDRILDETGEEIGRISETQKASGRRARQRGVYDLDNARVIKLVQRRKIVGKPLPVEGADGAGEAVGRIVPHNRRKTCF